MRPSRFGLASLRPAAPATRVFIAALFVCLLLSAPVAASPILDMQIGSGGSCPPSIGNYGDARVLGWKFSLSVSLDIRGLGIWDGSDEGLTGSHSIGLWTSGGTLLSWASMGAGSYEVASQVPAIGRWLFMLVTTPLSIGPGDYVLGATYASNDPDSLRVSGSGYPYVTLPGVTFLESRTLSSSTLKIPGDFHSYTDVLLGPNLDANVVPEPGTLLLLGAGLAGLAGRMRRRRG